MESAAPAVLDVFLLQIDAVWQNKTANHAKALALANGARPRAGGLVVLPEMFATGFSRDLGITVEPEGGLTERVMAEIARTHDCCVIGGVVTPGGAAAGGKGRNQAVALAPDGAVLARYTKIRPFTLGGEADVHVSGVEPVVFGWQGVKIAPLICYDLRFPEIARAAVGLGAEVLIFIAAWPVKRQQHWITLLQARAIENQTYVIGVNRCGQEPEFNYSGRSLVVDPHGVIIADASEREQVLRAEIDPAVVRQWRRDFPALRDAGLCPD